MRNAGNEEGEGFVSICALVRQWPGNKADIDFEDLLPFPNLKQSWIRNAHWNRLVQDDETNDGEIVNVIAKFLPCISLK